MDTVPGSLVTSLLDGPISSGLSCGYYPTIVGSYSLFDSYIGS